MNIVEAKSHNNNIISHNIQENKNKKMQGNYPQTCLPTSIEVVTFLFLVVNLIMFHPTKVSSTLIWVIVNHVDLHHKSMFSFLICKSDMLLGFAKGLKFPLWYVQICKLCGFTSKTCVTFLLVCKCGMFLVFVKGSKFPFWYANVVSSLDLQNAYVFLFVL